MVMHGVAGYFESVLFSQELYERSLSTSASGGVGGSVSGGDGSGRYDFTPTSPRSPRTPVRGSASSVSGKGVSGKGGSVRPHSPVVPPPPGGLTKHSSVGASGAGGVDGTGESDMAEPTTSNTTSSTTSEEDVVMLSIAPQSHTPGMQSWFPLFIPLAQPVRVKKGDVITVHIWRYVLYMVLCTALYCVLVLWLLLVCMFCMLL